MVKSSPVRMFLTGLVLLLSFAQIHPVSAQAATVTAVSEGTIGGHGHAGLYAWGATTLPDGSVLIGDYWNFRIVHYAENGALLSGKGGWVTSTSPGFARHFSPYGMAVDAADGWVYVADANNYRIDRFDLNGNYIDSFGSHGNGPGQFEYPSRVAVGPNHNIYVSDGILDQVEVFTPSASSPATWSSSFGKPGSGDGQFAQPLGLAFDAQGRLWVVDALNYRVQLFDVYGKYLTQFGSHGTAQGQFHGNLRGIAIDQSRGLAYIVDGAANWIDEFDMNFNLVQTIGSAGSGPGQFTAGGREVTVDGNGDVWVANMPDFCAYKFTSTGAYLLEVPSPPKLPRPGGFNGPRGVAFDSAGDSFVTDTYNQRIEEFGPTGQFLAQWGTRGQGEFAFNYPRGVAVNQATGDLIVADTDNNKVKDYQWLNGKLTFRWQQGRLSYPYGVDVDPSSGQVFVADTGHHRVDVLDPATGAIISSWGSGFEQLQGIDVAPDGSIWTTDQGTCLVAHFSPAGVPIGAPFGGCGTGPAQFQRPYGVETDGTYVYVTDAPSDSVRVWTVAGALVGQFGTPGGQLGEMRMPQGLDFGPNGWLYVVEQGNDRVQEFSVAA